MLPHVRHFWPGSSVPSLPSIRPPCTARPSSSYVSGAVISATEYLRISLGDHMENRMPSMAFTVCTDIFRSSPL